MQPVNLNAADVSIWVGRLWWPMLRIGGFALTAPAFSETVVPRMVKIALTVTLAFLMAPLAQVPATLSILSAAGLLAALQEMLIGVAIGMVVQLANTTVLGQMFMIFGILTYLAVNGHLLLLGALAESFRTLPIGAAHIDGNFALSVALWGARVFESGLLIALPAVIALVIVNLALGVVTRAAPQLNLFGIGFTITLLCGFFVLSVGLDGIMSGISSLINSALLAVADLVRAPAVEAH
jgi:flagellar biosynthetic protein FliR